MLYGTMMFMILYIYVEEMEYRGENAGIKVKSKVEPKVYSSLFFSEMKRFKK